MSNPNPMPSTNLSPAMRHRIRASTPEASSDSLSGFTTVSSSWATTHNLSSAGTGLERAPLAWAGVRHQVVDDTRDTEVAAVTERNTGTRCTPTKSRLMKWYRILQSSCSDYLLALVPRDDASRSRVIRLDRAFHQRSPRGHAYAHVK